jgi:serine phosphatase RsbU (regulator of sigma subunit)
MSRQELKSKAFQQAALKSESFRVIGMLVLFCALLLFAIARGLATGHPLLLLAQFLVLAMVIAHEVIMLRNIKAALREETDVLPELWMLNVLIESQIPTIGLCLLISTPWFKGNQALLAPVAAVYFLLIILSTLRLSPILSVTTGLLSALGYLAVVFFFGRTVSETSLTAWSLATHLIYAGTILSGGIIAAGVAGQIRSHVAAALREAELQGKLERVNHDLEIARSIQQGLMPATPPELDQFEVAGWNQPADQTGGDYFDWTSLPDGRFAISLADATGHGIGPALVSASCRAYARASFLANGNQDHLLDHLNRLLVDDLSANRFITFVVAFLDPSSKQVKILSAGHGPILWSKYETNRIENLEAQGIPLGMIAGIKYGTGTELRLGSGDMLVMVTDGFYEWENPQGEEFGINRLEAVLREARDYPAAEIITRLRSAVANFCQGTEQKDDLTAVILKRKREPSPTLKEVFS